MDALLEQRIQYLERLLSTKTRSPIVVQLAFLYLEAGRPHDALRYCDNAIAHFPYYTTAHLIRAKVLSALEMRAEARRELDFVHSILPDVDAVRTMLAAIPASETETFEEPAQAEQKPATSPTEPESPVVRAAEDTAVLSAFGPESGSGAEAPADLEPRDSADDFSRPTGSEDAFAVEPSASVAEEVREEEPPSVAAEPTADEVNTFGDLGPVTADTGTPLTSEPAAETYESFAETMRRELAGTENTSSMQEFLAAREPSPAEAERTDDIEELTEKLKNAPRITPVIDITEKKAPPPSEEDTPASTGFVTPTLAEIYAKQGWYDDAIVAYKTLARIKPAERERFEKRIQELEALKRSEGGGT